MDYNLLNFFPKFLQNCSFFCITHSRINFLTYSDLVNFCKTMFLHLPSGPVPTDPSQPTPTRCSHLHLKPTYPLPITYLHLAPPPPTYLPLPLRHLTYPTQPTPPSPAPSVGIFDVLNGKRKYGVSGGK